MPLHLWQETSADLSLAIRPLPHMPRLHLKSIHIHDLDLRKEKLGKPLIRCVCLNDLVDIRIINCTSTEYILNFLADRYQESAGALKIFHLVLNDKQDVKHAVHVAYAFLGAFTGLEEVFLSTIQETRFTEYDVPDPMDALNMHSSTLAKLSLHVHCRVALSVQLERLECFARRFPNLIALSIPWPVDEDYASEPGEVMVHIHALVLSCES